MNIVKEVVSYSVVHGELESVIRQVNSLLMDGWEPIGNINTLDGVIFHQSIIKTVIKVI